MKQRDDVPPLSPSSESPEISTGKTEQEDLATRMDSQCNAEDARTAAGALPDSCENARVVGESAIFALPRHHRLRRIDEPLGPDKLETVECVDWTDVLALCGGFHACEGCGGVGVVSIFHDGVYGGKLPCPACSPAAEDASHADLVAALKGITCQVCGHGHTEPPSVHGCTFCAKAREALAKALR